MYFFLFDIFIILLIIHTGNVMYLIYYYDRAVVQSILFNRFFFRDLDVVFLFRCLTCTVYIINLFEFLFCFFVFRILFRFVTNSYSCFRQNDKQKVNIGIFTFRTTRRESRATVWCFARLSSIPCHGRLRMEQVCAAIHGIHGPSENGSRFVLYRIRLISTCCGPSIVQENERSPCATTGCEKKHTCTQAHTLARSDRSFAR